jgi:hypothetical protein
MWIRRETRENVEGIFVAYFCMCVDSQGGNALSLLDKLECSLTVHTHKPTVCLPILSFYTLALTSAVHWSQYLKLLGFFGEDDVSVIFNPFLLLVKPSSNTLHLYWQISDAFQKTKQTGKKHKVVQGEKAFAPSDKFIDSF